MARLLSVALIAAILAACTSAQEKGAGSALITDSKATPGRTSLRGVWMVKELTSREVGGEWKTLPINSSLYIFTEKHYSYMFAPGIGPRRLYSGDPNRPSDAEKVAAYDSFVAASGTYVLSEGTLALTALLHKNPNEMVGEPLTYQVEIDGNLLRMTISNPPFSPGRERRTMLTRVE
jgi:hypothetical protein